MACPEESPTVSSEDSSSVSSEESSASLILVEEEMTEAIATLKNTTGDVSATIENKDILEAKFHDPYFTYSTKSQRLRLGDNLADIGAAQVFTSNIQWLRGTEHGGFSEDVFHYMHFLYICCHNYSDGSEKFAEELGEAGIIPVLVKDLDAFKETWTTNENYEAILDSSLGIMYNMSRMASIIRPLISENNAIGSLTPYLTVDNEQLKTVATLTLAYVLDEEDMGILADPSVIGFIIKVFANAVDDEKKSFTGFSATELAMGIEQLAVNDTPGDTNKQALVEGGVLPPLFKLMSEGDEEEQLLAILAISQLSFHRDNKEEIRPVIPQLQEFKSSENPDIAAATSGALWQLQDAESRQQKDIAFDDSDTGDHKGGGSVRHVMLSYQWDNQKIVKKIKATLEAKGHKVWMDIDQMGGSTLEAMAGAVENAAVVLICMSRKYKESANCRGECEYARERQIDIIPLKLEDGYRPDGWLGFLVGARLYFNFDCADTFEDVMVRLIREIGDRGKGREPDATVVQAVTELEVGAATTKPQGSNLHKDIRAWAEENHLEGDLEKLEPEDLNFLRWMKKEAPAEFCKSIEDELGLKSISSKRKFCSGLDKLEKTRQSQTFRRDKNVVKGSSTCRII